MALSQTLEHPWCVLGDFNSVLHQGERIGGLDVTDGEVKDFTACIQHCGLQKFFYEGAFFTWINKIVWSRIDRALHNELCYEGQAYTHMYYMSQGLSNCTLIILSFPHCPKPRYTFQFCDMWTKDKGFRDMVKHSLAHNQKSSKMKTLQQDPFNKDLIQQEASCRDHYIAINHSSILLIKQQSDGVGERSDYLAADNMIWSFSVKPSQHLFNS
ncbi:hypothetical protein Cgig2_029104 [Carnegiea gigantea]|uniref:Uncharacterized protein n=1 Tax=Carnegiea gigantea TaxID=171969 RepID=A0A9Q1GK91_9CARY|nr:hypothetical protein Cgig2_029104 [Carnegiea gigantea]